jgi:hypothetical protein
MNPRAFFQSFNTCYAIKQRDEAEILSCEFTTTTCYQPASTRQSFIIEHIPAAARFEALDDHIGGGYGAAEQELACIPFLLIQRNIRRLAVIYRTLQQITFAQTATSIAATMRQFVTKPSRGFEDGFAVFGDKSEAVRLERDTESHVVFRALSDKAGL